MKLIKHFDDFLKNVVNLNQSRLVILKDRVIAIEKYLKNNDMFGDAFVELKSQGSWVHKTIIKPSEKRPEFDADVLFYMHEFENWEPKEYVEKLYQEFRKNGLYKDKVHRSTRCVVVDYKGEFHIDIVPTFVRNEGFFIEDSHTYITNRIDNILEETNPEGYIDWFDKKNKQTNGNLIKVIRLAKYLRDIKQTFSVKSILLTTLLSDQVKTGFGDADDPDVDYPDVPTALKTIFNRLNEFLQVNEEIPHVHNPSLPDEDFIRHWDKPKYTNFRNKTSFYTEKIDAAYNEENRDESILKWREIFGDDFAGSVLIEKNSSVSNAITSFSHTKAISRFNVPHRQPPRWPIVQKGNVTVTGWVSRNGFRSQQFQNGTMLPKHCSLSFKAKTNISWPYKVYWQVVNTDEEARASNCLRGGFYDGIIEKGGRVRKESTLYTGMHWIECFIVKNGVCVASSGEFVVNIK